ncbi:MAG: HAMP domain-containing sensor histidine kinase [Longimonas sp.]|uniref:sensor histidine kinase n=1 Tax=Longimonas sp. TaxID=2039626 RepID=UPI00334902BB
MLLVLISPLLFRYEALLPILGYVMIGVAIVAFLVWGYRHMRARNQRLERLVEQRTARIQLQARQLARYNAELIRSNKMLQRTVDEKSQVLGVAAHDLKNAVFGIQALSEVMLEDKTHSEATARRLGLIHNSADEAMELIMNLLSSAASSVHGSMEKRPFDLNSMAELVTHSFTAQAERKNQSITCFVPPEPVLVEGDEDRLREAVNNLVSNAVKYSPLDSTISIEVVGSNSHAYISVEDEGPGIGEHEQEELFKPFERLSTKPTGNEGSSGLGLYIVKQIVERHQGHIEVDSEKGNGSTFTIALPRIEAPQEDKPSDGVPHERSAPPTLSFEASAVAELRN